MENELPNPGRIPKEDDLVALCRALNERGARYLIVGGFAVIHHGYLRATEDVDLLLDGYLDNQARVKKPLETFPDKAILELRDDDLREYLFSVGPADISDSVAHVHRLGSTDLRKRHAEACPSGGTRFCASVASHYAKQI